MGDFLQELGLQFPLFGFSVIILIVLARHYLSKEKEFTERRHYYQEKIQELILLNQEHSENFKNLTAYIKDNDRYYKAWIFFLDNHKPDLKRCSWCPDKHNCPLLTNLNI